MTTGFPDWDRQWHYAKARAEDFAGNVGESAWKRFCVYPDTTPPTVTITSPVSGERYSSCPPLEGTVSDPESGLYSASCQVTMQLGNLVHYWNWSSEAWQTANSTSCNTPLQAGAWQVTDSLPRWNGPEPLALKVWAFNNDGYGDMVTSVFYIQDTNPPAGVITLPAEGGSYHPGLTSIRGTASDGESGVAAVACALRWDAAGGAKYWNHISGTWQSGVTEECWKLAAGTTGWEITSGLPAPWPQQQSYTALASITDVSGNSASVSSAFRIGDFAAPVISAITATPSVLSSNNKFAVVQVAVTASDAIDPAPVSRITGVTCNETIPTTDWVVTGPLTVKLRASRNTSTKQRIYTIHASCTDASGNTATGTTLVTVPAKTKR